MKLSVVAGAVLVMLLATTGHAVRYQQDAYIEDEEDQLEFQHQRRYQDAGPQEMGENHYGGDMHMHNSRYDHEAFLGDEEARDFAALRENEAKLQLASILGYIDKNADHHITVEELHDWLKKVKAKESNESFEEEWRNLNAIGGIADWETYEKKAWGNFSKALNEEEKKQMEKDINREKKRWEKADENDDGKLTKDEYKRFAKPEHYPDMKAVVAKEAMDDDDKDDDGYIDLVEYIKSLHPKKEPSFIQREVDEKRFHEVDEDKNGKLDLDEVEKWIFEDNELEKEAKHLVQLADEDKDGKLSSNEIMDNYDIFVGHDDDEEEGMHDEL